MAVRIRPQDFIHVGLEPVFWGSEVRDVTVVRRLDTKERDLVVSLHTERISPINVVPTIKL